MKRIETSKKVLGAVLVVCFVYMTAIIIGWFMKIPDAPAMAGVVAGIASVVVGFYEWKARRENELKIKLTYGKNTESEEVE